MTNSVALGAPHARRLGRSTLAVVTGLLVIVVLSLGTDQIMHSLGIYPPWGEPMHDHGLFALALSYRLGYQVLGAYFTAKLAPHKPWRHVWILGSVGFVLSILGLLGTMSKDLGPLWYPIALVISVIPTTWLGGLLYQRVNGQR
jgi:hypothetical protein